MNEELKVEEQKLANEFGEKLDVTATPVQPASETETFTPAAPEAPAPEQPAQPEAQPVA